MLWLRLDRLLVERELVVVEVGRVSSVLPAGPASVEVSGNTESTARE